MFILACGTVSVYKEEQKPVFISNGMTDEEHSSFDSLVVISYNIEKGKKINGAIADLHQFATPIDILLLQEMDEAGVKYIADTFRMNYLYFPVVYNRLQHKNVGNAILSRGIISNPEKLILPHAKWINGRRRHVTIGEVMIRHERILVYSVHTETSSMSRKRREDQRLTILGHALRQRTSYERIIIGGDFNTLFPDDAERLVKQFADSGFQWATSASGHTARALEGLVKPREDYIFSSGLLPVRGGKLGSATSSDHLPVYAVFFKK